MKSLPKACIVAAIICAAPFVQAAPCTDGESGGYTCSHVEFLGRLSIARMGGVTGEVLNDIWGWTDPLTGEEYALVGMQHGTAFVRILDDGTPVYLGRLPASDGQANVDPAAPAPPPAKACHDELCGEDNSAWRDIKVLDHYAYIVSEGVNHGLQVFDLETLRAHDGTTPVVFNADTAETWYGYYGGIGHAHNLFINAEATPPRAYIVGHDGAGRAGGLHVLDLADPMAPQFIGEVDNDGYTHDVQCVVYTGPAPNVVPGSEICFASNEDTLTIWDVTDAANPALISKTGYPGASYTHQGWLSEDQRYFFLNDELDETNNHTRTHLRVFDVSEILVPVLAADYLAPTLSVDHNNYVHGRWLYQSNYGAGFRILDVLDPLHPVEAAYFDTQPTDLPDFYGNWSNYRLPSGKVVLSDIHDGLFVVQPTVAAAGIAPDISVSMTLAATGVSVSEPLEGEVIVSAGAAADASDTLLTLHLPNGAFFTAIDAPSGWTCLPVDDGRIQECRSPLLAAGSRKTFAFTLKSHATNAVNPIAMAYAGSADAAPADNLATASARISVEPVKASGGGASAWLLPLLLVPALRRGLPGNSSR